MKLTDMIFSFQSASYIQFKGLCRVRTFINSIGNVFCLITDIGTMNPSASVTNSIERICKQVIAVGLVPPETKFVEHYESDFTGYNGTSLDLVSFDHDGFPNWKKIALTKAAEMFECDVEEFKDQTLENNRLMSEIQKLRYEMDTKMDFPYLDEPQVISRRYEIEANKIGKKQLSELVKNGATEQELSRLLKQDLSFFGEVYGHPNEEYICFSEFPLDDGFVDFVVFTGRSRMDIYLIEIKGANFNLVNNDHYEKFSNKVEEAASQIRNRLQKIYAHYENYRVDCHRIREKVESGNAVYNSFTGPMGKLVVDPNKHVNIRTVIIGG